MVTPAWAGPAPAGAVVDLDDTLYPQADYLAGAVAAVATAAGRLGLDRRSMADAFAASLAQGSDRGGTIDRALAALGVRPDEAAALVPALAGAFAAYAPPRLTCYPGAKEALARLRAGLPVVCLTDGNPDIQMAKLTGLGLAGGFDAIVLTDRLGGRSTRKPHPAGLWRAADLLGVSPNRLVVIGDRPDKDVAVAQACGARAIRIRQGEYAHAPDRPAAWAVTDDFPEAAAIVLEVLAGTGQRVP